MNGWLTIKDRRAAMTSTVEQRDLALARMTTTQRRMLEYAERVSVSPDIGRVVFINAKGDSFLDVLGR